MGEILNQVQERKAQLMRQKAFVDSWSNVLYNQRIAKLNQIITWLQNNEGD